MELETPKDSQCFHEGSHYKKGDKGKAFRWSDGEWFLSEKPWHKLEAAIADKSKRSADALDAEEERQAKLEQRKREIKTLSTEVLRLVRQYQQEPPTTKEIAHILVNSDAPELEGCTEKGVQSSLRRLKGTRLKHGDKRKCSIGGTAVVTWRIAA